MGLISKIEDKLSSNKGESESSKLQKSSYEDSSSSHLRHPVSSGTTSQGYGSSTSGTQGYGSSTTGTSGSQGYGGSKTGATGSSAMPGSYDSPGRSGVERDGYGQSSSGYSKTDSRDTSGGYGNSIRTDPRDTTSGGYGSSGRTEPREPYDPYSSKGQATAANAGTGYSSGNSREEYGGSSYANDPNVPRSREGGVMNPGSSSAARNPDAIPTAGGQRVGSTDVNDPYTNTSSNRQDPHSTSTTNSSGHPIRDAALGGAAGTAMGGAAGYGASRYGDDRSAQEPSSTYGQHSSSSNPQDPSYMNRSGGTSGMDSGMGSGMTSSTQQPSGMTGSSNAMGSSSAPHVDPKKMGGAYEAGYRDAMEHAKEQMGLNK